ncbi:thioredoxin [Candidatus Woesearchaeota archaeon]|nr:thioredoxin [Candidatus Woesearchaeota archaeon]
MEINESEFEEKVLEKSKEMPVVVDFYADWCGPCQMLAPIMEKLEEEYKEKVVFVKINTDNNPAASQKYGITGIPAVKLFKDGEVADEFVGLQSEDMIKQWLNKNL